MNYGWPWGADNVIFHSIYRCFRGVALLGNDDGKVMNMFFWSHSLDICMPKWHQKAVQKE